MGKMGMEKQAQERAAKQHEAHKYKKINKDDKIR